MAVIQGAFGEIAIGEDIAVSFIGSPLRTVAKITDDEDAQA